MQATGSISRGKTAEKHNTRECYRGQAPANIDRLRTPKNVTLVNRPLEDVYRERFGAALDEYNAKQVEKKHPERQIPDYLAKVREDKKLQPMYEFVVQVGNIGDRPDAEAAKRIYSDWLAGFEKQWGRSFEVKQAIIHMDEAVPHMHVELVPCAESKRGLAIQNSMNKAVRQAGFQDYKAMLAGWDVLLTECMERHGIERVAGDREKQMGGVDIDTYKRSMAVKRETDEAEQRLERLRREVEQAELEPPAETIAESARSLWEARGSGKREEVLRSEIEGLRSRLSASEDESRELAGEIRELERGISRLERGIIGARERVQELAAQVRGYVEHVGERVAAVLTGFGVRAYAGAAPLSENVRDVRDASRELGRAGSDQERGRGWDMSR